MEMNTTIQKMGFLLRAPTELHGARNEMEWVAKHQWFCDIVYCVRAEHILATHSLVTRWQFVSHFDSIAFVSMNNYTNALIHMHARIHLTRSIPNRHRFGFHFHLKTSNQRMEIVIIIIMNNASQVFVLNLFRTWICSCCFFFLSFWIFGSLYRVHVYSRLNPDASGDRSGLQMRSRSPSSLVWPSSDSSLTGGDSDVHTGLDESVRNDSFPLNSIPWAIGRKESGT